MIAWLAMIVAAVASATSGYIDQDGAAAKKGFVTRVPLEVATDGSFGLAAVLDDKRRPGLYEISVWGKVPGGEHVMLGLRTIRVD